MAEDAEGEAPTKKSRLPLILGVILMLALGGGSFFAVYSGRLLGAPATAASDATATDQAAALPPLADSAFVPIDPLVINLRSGSQTRHLRFHAQLEVPSARVQEVAGMLPRVTDILNGYLRALELSELEDAASLIRLRSQILRRVQLVLGEGRVRDVLIMEFVVN